MAGRPGLFAHRCGPAAAHSGGLGPRGRGHAGADRPPGQGRRHCLGRGGVPLHWPPVCHPAHRYGVFCHGGRPLCGRHPSQFAPLYLRLFCAGAFALALPWQADGQHRQNHHPGADFGLGHCGRGCLSPADRPAQRRHGQLCPPTPGRGLFAGLPNHGCAGRTGVWRGDCQCHQKPRHPRCAAAHPLRHCRRGDCGAGAGAGVYLTGLPGGPQRPFGRQCQHRRRSSHPLRGAYFWQPRLVAAGHGDFVGLPDHGRWPGQRLRGVL